MKRTFGRGWGLKTLGAVSLACGVALAANAAGPEVVKGPGSDPNCFKPWADATKLFKYQQKSGPYRIALANGFIGNTWRIQMIKTAKAYADQPSVTVVAPTIPTTRKP